METTSNLGRGTDSDCARTGGAFTTPTTSRTDRSLTVMRLSIGSLPGDSDLTRFPQEMRATDSFDVRFSRLTANILTVCAVPVRLCEGERHREFGVWAF